MTVSPSSAPACNSAAGRPADSASPTSTTPTGPMPETTPTRRSVAPPPPQAAPNPVLIDTVLTCLALLAVLGTCLSIDGVFTTNAWVGPCVLVACAVAAGSWLTRLFATATQLPRGASVAGGLVGLVAALTFRFSRPEAYGGIIPSLDSLQQLWNLIRQGRADLANLSVPPVTASSGLLMWGALLVGLTMLVLDWRGVSYRSPASAGVALLVLFSVPTILGATPGLHRASLWGFVLGGLCYLIWLHVDRNDRRVAPTRRAGLWGVAGIGPVALTLGILAPLALAAAIPTAFPVLSQGLLDTGRNQESNLKVDVVNPVLDLQQDLTRRNPQKILRYRSSSPAGQYIRLVALDAFNGQTWDSGGLQVPQDQVVKDGISLDDVPGNVPRTEQRTTIEIDTLNTRWLPLPYTAIGADVSDAWVYDKQTRNSFGKTESTQDLGSYEVKQVELTPTLEQLSAGGAPPESMQRFLALPNNFSATLRAKAREVTKGETTAFGQAKAIEKWLQGFDYDVHAPNRMGTNALEEFLKTRRGFCVHFSSMMAVMARDQGIPARVAVGYLPGKQTGDMWQVTTRDAHAWPELYFPGAGWVRFEPTPNDEVPIPPNQSSPANPPTSQPEPSLEPSEQPEPTPSSSTSPSDDPSPSQSPTTIPSANPSEVGVDNPAKPLPVWVRWLLIGLAILAGLTLLAMTPRWVAAWVRHRRWQGSSATPEDTARAAEAQLRADARDFGLTWRDQETPRQFCTRLAAAIPTVQPAERKAAQRLATVIERWRFGPKLEDASSAPTDVAILREGLERGSSRWQRLRTTWFPPSLFRRG